jgi:exonuclease III
VKIATWNIERPRVRKVSMKNDVILKKLREENPDILILTETNSCIDLGPGYDGFPSEVKIELQSG